MALDKQLADKLWNERYEGYLRNLAQKNRYLHDTKDPEDLFQDMAINVWVKAVNAFDPSRTSYAGGDIERAFNAFVSQIAGQYLASLSAHHDTGKQEWERGLDSVDRPVKNSEGESKDTILDRLTDPDLDSDPSLKMDLDRIISSLPEELGWAVQYIVDNAEPGNIGQLFKDIREKYPKLTQQRLFNGLTDNPAFVEFITSI